ncbi:Amidase (plasmid) [Rhizobium leguminosarum bv. trifolii WSM2304]|uniref:Indoleacetamide hydrolase n=1 Tax=Rhizobium leguminosarum bv. trifolii (strain WSM2304) TaxID=395492 RepID=A0ABF7QZX1_RHILW|nr:amidase [Rhizobium leguminosarum]ACI59710.1 Amidase [Rhizobium leguminosarum bv. trifolii WSM2304]
MPSFDSDYGKRDGLELADLLYCREISPKELMESAIAAAEAVNPALNAFCFPRHEAALVEAEKATLQGTFGALPFAFKDSGLAAQGHGGSIGSRLFSKSMSHTDSTLAARFRKDGFISFGRTTVPEMCMAPTTEARQNGGATRNPWDHSRSAGGSSGGAAVAVATGVVPIAHGSDGGGSIRIPAACCGLYGLKTSRGLVPHGPNKGEGWGGLAVHGILTRSVYDSAAALNGIAGMEPGAPYASPERPDSFLESLELPFDRALRIAKWTVGWDGIPIAPDCLAALEKAEHALVALGHEVVDVYPPELDYTAFVEALIDVLCTNAAMSVSDFLTSNPVENWRDLLEPAIQDACAIGNSLPAMRYVAAISTFHRVGRALDSYMASYDFVISPTLTQPPLPLAELSMDTDFRSFRRKAARYTMFLALLNASGQPAANLPLFKSSSGLPIGVQLIGRFGQDAEILKLSAQLECETGWADLQFVRSHAAQAGHAQDLNGRKTAPASQRA